jgi:hypothetical protein
MTSPQLQTFRDNLAANTLTDAERGALLAALDQFLPIFPQPDDISAASEDMPAIAIDWVSALFTIQGPGGTPVPTTDLTDVTGTAPIVVTSPTAATRNVALAAGALPIFRVANIAALQALTIAAPATVDSVGASWTYEPAGALAVDGITVVAATGLGVGQWWRGPSLVTASALAQAAWTLDPQNGSASDENSGVDAAHALKTIGEVYRRWGTTTPRLTAAVVNITWLSDGLTTDNVVARAIQGTLFLNGTQTAAAPIVLGTFVAKNKAAGTLATIHVAGHGAWTPGTLIHDTTANAGFWVVADLGGDTASISQPLSLPINTGSTEVALANGDSLTLVTQTAITPLELGSSDGSNFTFVQHLALSQAGAVVALGKAFINECSLAGLSYQSVKTIAVGSTPFLTGCYSAGTGGGANGLVSGAFTIFGGAYQGAGNSFADGSILDLDVVFPLRGHFGGTIELGSVYLGQFFEYTAGFNGQRIELHSTTTPPQPTTLYGPATIDVAGGATLAISSATTAVASLLCTGGVNLDGPAFSFNGGTGAYVGPTAVTPANIDAGGGLQSPSTGSRISFTA